MSAKLNQFQNWLERAQQTGWSVSGLAKSCGVSVRTLHRHFLATKGKTTKAWLAAKRLRIAIELLDDGISIKETAWCLGYKKPNNFTREFKRQFSRCPSQQQPQDSSSELKLAENDR
jgi:AraC family transcriptional regulator, transcriptional activator FtrA